jgi:hypothetical protein
MAGYTLGTVTILPLFIGSSHPFLFAIYIKARLTCDLVLRPVVRPGNQRSNAQASQPPFLLPNAPPDAADLETKRRRPTSSIGAESFFSSTFTIPKPPKSRAFKEPTPSLRSPPKASTHVRAHSFSTIDDHAPRPSLDQPGTFKVVIHRRKPSTPKEDLDTSELPPLPVIEVPIPHYRLGTPQFGTTGTALMRSSVYTRTSSKEDPYSSEASNLGRLLTTPSALRSSYQSRRHSDAFPRPLFDRASSTEMGGARSSMLSQSGQSIATVAASLYDHLALNPNDPSTVRYATDTTEIIAATPSRLIAHITSPSFLDYELLSDFFLTFRSFIQPDELVSFLISRLRWAVNRSDDFGRIVRVRTFVALRHWILNYFVDDFLSDEPLRAHFCNLVNALYGYLRSRSDGGGGDLKIIGELKKCWRRTCTLHWPPADATNRESPEDEILPGGPVEKRNSLDSSLVLTVPPPVHKPTRVATDESIVLSHSAKPSTVKQPEAAKTGHHAPKASLASAGYSAPYTTTRTGTLVTEPGIPISPSSERSTTVMSCSIPMKPIYRSDRGAEMPLFPHPVPATSLTISSIPTTSKQPNPLQSHLRTQSFYDPLRGQKVMSFIQSDGADFVLPDVYLIPGSLVRGVLYQPESPYFDIRSFGSLRLQRPSVPVVEEIEATTTPQAGKQPPQANPGVKKLFGSVRRALGNKPVISPSESALPAAGTNPNTGAQMTEVSRSSQQPRKSAQRLRTQVRIDLLAARVEETFKEAIEAGMEEDRAMERDILAFTKGQSGSESNGTTPRTRDPRFDRSFTIGSRSIVIMDDTNADHTLMSGALNPPDRRSQETLSRYEDYVARATYDFRNQQDLKLAQSPGGSMETGIRETKISSPGTLPAVYIPTGFQSPLKSAKEGPGALRLLSRQRFSNSLRSSLAATPSLRRYASYHSGDSNSRYRRAGDTSPAIASKSAEGDQFVLGKPPVRQLRRKPGGDLKAATNIHDLEQPQRPQSAGSAVRVDSITLATSPIALPQKSKTMAATPKRRKLRDSEDGQRRSISLIQTHSSQPNLRPSFEAEVAKLAALPDDELDDGGIEAALLKLEGKYEKKSPTLTPSPTKSEITSNTVKGPVKSEHPAKSVVSPVKSEFSTKSRKIRHHHEHVQDIHPDHAETTQTKSVHRFSQSSDIPIPHHLGILATPKSTGESEESYSSIPLLERSHSGPTAQRKNLDRLVIRDSDSMKSIKEPNESANSSIEHVVETESMRRIPHGGTLPVPRSPTMHESFLLDDTLDMTDGQEDPSVERLYESSDVESQGVRSFFDDEAFDDERPDSSVFTHPLRQQETPLVVPETRKVTPPMASSTTFNQGLPTPGITPTAKLNFPAGSPTTPVNRTKEHRRARPSEITSTTTHLPFILAFEAEILAQQFTLIEKDALDEIDWKELIELRWKQTSPTVRDWVEYLRTQDPHGVDLVIARFNLVVKWIVSEIVLTEIPDERVRCIVQYIHIAAHCRRLRNFATMYQITIALLSADCSRLRRTWEHVPAADQQTFKELEAVVQPIRNFHNLRVEMETGMGDDGCIPFIGKLCLLTY